MKQIYILKGLPASGKSTWAKTKISENPGMFKRVNKDELRAMLDGGRWSFDNEKYLVNLRDHIIIEALKSGKHVIVDDTNLHDKHETRIRQIVKENKIEAQFNIKFFDASVEECIKRDLKRPNSVGFKVITDMYNQFLKPKQEIYTPLEGARVAIIVDIDGTLAKMDGRGPFDWDRVGEDKVNEPIKGIVNTYYNKSIDIIIMTGRDGVCEQKTKNWLKENGISWDKFLIRPKDNTEKDTIIKKRMFDEYIRDKYNILFVLDDRNVVVEMWRSLGLTCLQVAYGDF